MKEDLRQDKRSSKINDIRTDSKEQESKAS